MQTPLGRKQPTLFGYVALIFSAAGMATIIWRLFTSQRDPDFVITAGCVLIAAFALAIYLIQQRRWLELVTPLSSIVVGISIILDRTILPGIILVGVAIGLIMMILGQIILISENKKHKLT